MSTHNPPAPAPVQKNPDGSTTAAQSNQRGGQVALEHHTPTVNQTRPTPPRPDPGKK